MDDNTIDFMEKFNQKNAEQNKELADNAMKKYMAIALLKIELITGKDVSDSEPEHLHLAICFDIANTEFLADDEYLDKYGEDEDTPSIQLLIINRVLNRALEIYFGERYQADKIKE